MFVNLGGSICTITQRKVGSLEGPKGICLTLEFPDIFTICIEEDQTRCYRCDTGFWMCNVPVDIKRHGAADRAELKPLVAIRVFGLGSVAEAADVRKYIYQFCAQQSWHTLFGWVKF